MFRHKWGKILHIYIYIENFIDLNHGILTNNDDDNLIDEFVEHGDTDFDIDEILNRVES